MANELELGDISVDVVRKDIQNVHLSVHPPSGRVRLAAPERMKMDTIRLYAISKLSWIKKQRLKIQEQERETPREYLDRESHYVWGKRYLLMVAEAAGAPSVQLKHKQMILTVRPGTEPSKRHQILETWYRQEVREKSAPLIEKWESKIGVDVEHLFVRRMRTRWGSCNSQAHTIRLNTDLAKKPRECLEYIIVHELIHILEPTHNERFRAFMNQFLPDWKQRRQALNHLPVRHEDWDY
jgi:predicted metal-dependent hydrolase